MPKFLSNTLTIAVLVCLAIGAYYFTRPKPEVVIVEKPIQVELSPAKLDSLKLAFYAEFKGQIKPKIIKIADSAKIKPLLSEIFALRDSLRGKAKVELSYYTENQPPYGDTLGAKADFISDSMSVVFRPKKRDFTVTLRDTITIPAKTGGFWDTMEKVGIFAGGLIVGGLLK